MSDDIRRYLNILTEAMSHGEALGIFKKAGVAADGMTAQQITKARNKLASKMHPDLGGSEEQMQDLNAAHDVLKDAAKGKKTTGGVVQRPFDMASAFNDDDKPDMVEKMNVNIFPIDRPTIWARWYGWHREFDTAETEQLLALKDGETVELDEHDRNSRRANRDTHPPHRGRATRHGDILVFAFTHHATKGTPEAPIHSADWGYLSYGIPISDMAIQYQELLRAPAKAKEIYAWNKAHPDGPWRS